jgi:hypothetical protein
MRSDVWSGPGRVGGRSPIRDPGTTRDRTTRPPSCELQPEDLDELAGPDVGLGVEAELRLGPEARDVAWLAPVGPDRLAACTGSKGRDRSGVLTA